MNGLANTILEQETDRSAPFLLIHCFEFEDLFDLEIDVVLNRTPENRFVCFSVFQ